MSGYCGCVLTSWKPSDLSILATVLPCTSLYRLFAGCLSYSSGSRISWSNIYRISYYRASHSQNTYPAISVYLLHRLRLRSSLYIPTLSRCPLNGQCQSVALLLPLFHFSWNEASLQTCLSTVL